jgi:carboxymethylenebutenolidase
MPSAARVTRRSDALVRTESIRVPSHDGDEFDAHLAVPDAATGPGMVLLQEALGVTDYTRDVAARLAGLGYVTLAPDLFWRIERNVDLPHDDSGLTRALELIGQFDPQAGVHDVEATFSYLRSTPDVNGPVGVIGFCFGGGLTYGAACELDPDCAVAYYGVGVELLTERIDEVTCPALLHFGTEDVFIPPDALGRLRVVARAKPNIEIEVYEGGGHAFDNPHAEWHEPGAAARAWDRTAAFLDAHLRGAG